MIFVKIHKSYRDVVAISDSNLMGKKFEEGKKQLEIKENFFKGKQYTYRETVELIKREKQEDSTFNIVGKESIKAAAEAGLIRESEIAKIQSIPFVLVLI